MDGSHFKIQKPKEDQASYYSGRKKIHSYNVLLACDSFGKFCYVDAHWPGSVHDSRVWRNSNLCTAVEQGLILNGPTVNIRGVNIP